MVRGIRLKIALPIPLTIIPLTLPAYSMIWAGLDQTCIPKALLSLQPSALRL
jgi:hypothetical protein